MCVWLLAFVCIVYYKNPMGIPCEKLNDCCIDGQIVWIAAGEQSLRWPASCIKDEEGLSLVSYLQGGPRTVLNSWVTLWCVHLRHLTHFAALTCTYHLYGAMCASLCMSASLVINLNLNVPVFCLSLNQPEEGSMLSYITGSNVYMPSKNSHFIQSVPFWPLF